MTEMQYLSLADEEDETFSKTQESTHCCTWNEPLFIDTVTIMCVSEIHDRNVVSPALRQNGE